LGNSLARAGRDTIWRKNGAPETPVPRAAWLGPVSFHERTRKVYLNPYTGALEGHTSFFNTQRFFRSFHRRLFDGDRGIFLVALMALPLLLTAGTGLLFYKGWLKQLVTLRTGKGRRLLWSDLHKGAGIWGLLFTLVIALTGLFYFVEIGFIAAGNHAALTEAPLPGVADSSLEGRGPQPDLLPAGAYVEAARDTFPGLDVRSVRMLQQPGEAVYVDGQAGNPLTRDRATSIPSPARCWACNAAARWASCPSLPNWPTRCTSATSAGGGRKCFGSCWS
jgi:uncharacterized iron-regulated membrane protein